MIHVNIFIDVEVFEVTVAILLSGFYVTYGLAVAMFVPQPYAVIVSLHS
jgi:hypothetical protein